MLRCDPCVVFPQCSRMIWFSSFHCESTPLNPFILRRASMGNIKRSIIATNAAVVFTERCKLHWFYSRWFPSLPRWRIGWPLLQILTGPLFLRCLSVTTVISTFFCLTPFHTHCLRGWLIPAQTNFDGVSPPKPSGGSVSVFFFSSRQHLFLRTASGIFFLAAQSKLVCKVCNNGTIYISLFRARFGMTFFAAPSEAFPASSA